MELWDECKNIGQIWELPGFNLACENVLLIYTPSPQCKYWYGILQEFVSNFIPTQQSALLQEINI
jgi:hypothetical protein